MKITIIGGGYVGLVSAACFSEFGLHVSCVDTDPAKIESLQRGHMPIYEPGLEEIVKRNVEAGRLEFTTELAPALVATAAVFIAVGTPTRRGDGHADVSHVLGAASAVADRLDHDTLLVTKSTVPVGTGAKLKALVAARRPDLAIRVASNPEFLREGCAIDDFMRPDRVVCGVEDEAARATLEAIYRPLNLNRTPLFFTSLETAELIKYATNSFLATKITFVNEIADLCEKVGADVQEVARGLGLDGRIGGKFLHAGPGYGGSCFPKDTLALVRTGELVDVNLRIVETVIQVNEHRKRAMVKKILEAVGGSVRGKTIGVLGITFKPNTDDTRESPSLVILPALMGDGAKVQAYDPEGMRNAGSLLDGVIWAADPYAALDGVDAALLLTEWNQFRGLDLGRIARRMRGNVFIDLRNVYDPRTVREAGMVHVGIGKAGRAGSTAPDHA